MKEGAAVVIIDIDEDAGNALQNRVPALCFYHGDIADETVLDNFEVP